MYHSFEEASRVYILSLRESIGVATAAFGLKQEA